MGTLYLFNQLQFIYQPKAMGSERPEIAQKRTSTRFTDVNNGE